jgi:hypothetical protein
MAIRYKAFEVKTYSYRQIKKEDCEGGLKLHPKIAQQ